MNITKNILFSCEYFYSEDLNSILKEASVSPPLGWLLSEIVIREEASISCVCVLTDPHYSPVLNHKFFLSIQYIPVFIVSNIILKSASKLFIKIKHLQSI